MAAKSGHMISEAYIHTTVHLDHLQIPVGMLYIWDFSEQETAAITGLKVSVVKKVREQLRIIFGTNHGNSIVTHALEAGYNIDGTLNGQDIFTDKQKRMILDIDPTIVFRFPVKELEHAPL